MSELSIATPASPAAGGLTLRELEVIRFVAPGATNRARLGAEVVATDIAPVMVERLMVRAPGRGTRQPAVARNGRRRAEVPGRIPVS